MIASGLQVEWTHDLNDLKGQLNDDWGVKRRAGPLGWLATWAIDGRYPSEGLADAALSDAVDAVRLATQALDSVRDDLMSRGFLREAGK